MYLMDPLVSSRLVKTPRGCWMINPLDGDSSPDATAARHCLSIPPLARVTPDV